MIKKFFCLLWTCSLQDIWVYLWSKTTVDEKTIAAVKEPPAFVVFIETLLLSPKELSDKLLVFEFI